jgi:hypothetical protein
MLEQMRTAAASTSAAPSSTSQTTAGRASRSVFEPHGRRGQEPPAHRGRGSYLAVWLSGISLENRDMEQKGREPLAEGPDGFVEEVVWSADATEVDALIVRRSCERGGTIRIPVGEVLCPEASKLIVAATVVDAPPIGEIRPAGGQVVPGTDGVWRSGAEEVDQLAALPLGQTAKRLRVSDPTVGKDASGPDRADLRQHQEDIAHSRCPHTRGWVGEDLHQLDLSRRELLLQLRSCRPNFVCLLQRTQPLFARSARNARTVPAL